MKIITIKKEEKYFTTLTKFLEELKSNFTSDVNKIITNGNMAAVMQDSASYEIEPNDQNILTTNGQIYKMGKIFNIPLYVDPMMKWTDNRIILKNDDTIIEEIVVDDNESLLM